MTSVKTIGHHSLQYRVTVDDWQSGNLSLLITSRNHNCIKRFCMDGNFLETIKRPGSFVCRPVVHKKNIYAAIFRSE